jgi:hypothetical protein
LKSSICCWVNSIEFLLIRSSADLPEVYRNRPRKSRPSP